MRCLVIGAGGAGKSIIQGLIKIKRVSEVYIMNRTLESSKRAADEIDSLKVKVFKKTRAPFLDYVILTLCAVDMNERIKNILESENTYQVRQRELEKNLFAVKKKLSFFKALPEKTKIIVVTNPVDGIENYLKNKLPKREIFGFGLQLDANRYSKVLKKSITVIGVHGKSIPLLNLPEEKSYDLLYKKVDEPFLKYIKWNGLPYHIYKKEFKKYFSNLISNKKSLIYTSYFLKNYLNKIFRVSIGFPFYIKKGEVVGMKKIKLNNIEMKRLERDAKILKKSIKKSVMSYVAHLLLSSNVLLFVAMY